VALGHDLRLASFYGELGLKERFFVEPNRPDVWPVLRDRVRRLLADPAQVRDALRKGNQEQIVRAGRTRELFRSFVQSHGWEVAT
jgi:hypothetical protein